MQVKTQRNKYGHPTSKYNLKRSQHQTRIDIQKSK